MKEGAMENPRMLERRVSNNRTDLNNDQQMNYLLSWFNVWSDLQKEDFVPILAEKINSKYAQLNGVSEDLKKLRCGNRPPSLFDCQIGLFKDWVVSWSDDQKNYLVLRLEDIDPVFFKKYETYLVHGKESPNKDYFEPGIPPELDLSIDRSSVASDFVVNDVEDVDETTEHAQDSVKIEEYQEVSFEETSESVSVTNFDSDDDEEEEDLCTSRKAHHLLSPIAEDSVQEA